MSQEIQTVNLTVSIWGHGAMAPSDLTRKITTNKNINTWIMQFKTAGFCTLSSAIRDQHLIKYMNNPEWEMDKNHEEFRSFLNANYAGEFNNLEQQGKITERTRENAHKHVKGMLQKPSELQA